MKQQSLVNINEEKYLFERELAAIDYQLTKATEIYNELL